MKKKVLFLVNDDVTIYNTRKELVERLINEGYEVVISSPYGERIEFFKQMGCKYKEVKIDRHGTNPLNELKLLFYYIKLISSENPQIIFSYTIKPNLYGSLAANVWKVPIVVNITGLGTAVENNGLMGEILTEFYRLAFRKVQTVFVQNKENRQFFIRHHIAMNRLKLLPGSGVNLEQFHVLDYLDDDTIEFVFISRIMKEKGIDQFLKMAEYIKKKYPQTRFHVCGFCEEKRYENILLDFQEKGIITYHGQVMDVREVLAITHCTVLPSYYPEGINNVLLESAASGRPIITTNRSGCKEVVNDGVNGYMISPRNTKELINAVERFLSLSNEERRQMGLAGRRKVEQEFDRNIVVEAYMQEIQKC